MRTIPILGIAALLLSFASARADDGRAWTRADTAWQVAFTALAVVDWGQTHTIARDPHRWERNPLLGKHPGPTEVNAHFAASIFGHMAVARALPRRYRRAWQVLWIGVEAGFVWHNRRDGVGLSFRW